MRFHASGAMDEIKSFMFYILWWGSVVPYKYHMIRARTMVLMYLASS